jgi:hypothetical protein
MYLHRGCLVPEEQSSDVVCVYMSTLVLGTIVGYVDIILVIVLVPQLCVQVVFLLAKVP